MNNISVMKVSGQNINFNGICRTKANLRKTYLFDKIANPRQLTKHDRELNYTLGCECWSEMKNKPVSDIIQRLKEELRSFNLDFVKGYLKNMDKNTKKKVLTSI